ncbi:hypothetical protein niasHS_010297 [Heterodera schachtii]|uniref:Uncharacterized protein n=1 Tax=Heterodera schachtii TaxID=97005 RepID=A0ABD2IZU2_HETSC
MLFRLTLFVLLPFVPSIADEFRHRKFEKTGREIRMATKVYAWGYQHLQEEIASSSAIDDIRLRSMALRTGRLPNSSGIWKRKSKMGTKNDSNANEQSVEGQHQKETMTAHARLIEDLVNRRFYEPTVHPRRNYLLPTRVNVSMSLYQLMEVDERSQTITANVWMVQDWYDEFLDWDPREYELLNRTIVPYEDIWIPDTVLYNSGNMDKKNSEAVMNAIVETGHWRNDGRGAAVQLMFPAIYKLSCKMNVRFFPYDQQNCSFIISSWTHDMATIDYHYTRPKVNMKNFVEDDEWTVISFDFRREELKFKCCARPWAMLYAHLVIRRKPLYYIVNLVVPTSIITVVAVIGFFTPSSSTSERDEKLYLGINTLLTMSLMLLMVTNQMPNTSNYVPLMGWYYMGIIFVIVFGTILATVVLFIHSRKARLQPLPRPLLKLMINPWFGALVLEPPSNLNELWTEYGLLVKKTDEQKQRADETAKVPQKKRQEASQAVGRERRRRETIIEAADFLAQGVYGQRKAELHQLQRKMRQSRHSVFGSGANARLVKRQKLMRRCALEWEFLANSLDRLLLFFFSLVTAFFFCLLAFYDKMFCSFD